jgi:hypothetical protein
MSKQRGYRFISKTIPSKLEKTKKQKNKKTKKQKKTKTKKQKNKFDAVSYFLKKIPIYEFPYQMKHLPVISIKSWYIIVVLYLSTGNNI